MILLGGRGQTATTPYTLGPKRTVGGAGTARLMITMKENECYAPTPRAFSWGPGVGARGLGELLEVALGPTGLRGLRGALVGGGARSDSYGHL